jgi:hypothetical protein
MRSQCALIMGGLTSRAAALVAITQSPFGISHVVRTPATQIAHATPSLASQPSRYVLVASFGLFDEITYLVEKASGLTPKSVCKGLLSEIPRTLLCPTNCSNAAITTGPLRWYEFSLSRQCCS